jgi:ATP-dependent RNA helicase DDX46/PRP5
MRLIVLDKAMDEDQENRKARRDRLREQIRRYQKSEKGRAKVREAQRRYDQSEKGRERNRRYRESLTEEQKEARRIRERDRLREKRAKAREAKRIAAAKLLGIDPATLVDKPLDS